MSITVQATTTTNTAGLERMIARLNAAAIEAIVAHFAQLIADTARELAPVETEGLKDSIRVVLEGMAAQIRAGDGLPDGRAVFQELGFRHFGSGQWVQNAYLTPAIEQHREAFIAAILALLKG